MAVGAVGRTAGDCWVVVVVEPVAVVAVVQLARCSRSLRPGPRTGMRRLVAKFATCGRARIGRRVGRGIVGRIGGGGAGCGLRVGVVGMFGVVVGLVAAVEGRWGIVAGSFREVVGCNSRCACRIVGRELAVVVGCKVDKFGTSPRTGRCWCSSFLRRWALVAQRIAM